VHSANLKHNKRCQETFIYWVLKKITVAGRPIFERINVHMQRYLHQAFNEKNQIFQLLSSDCEITWQWLFISIYYKYKAKKRLKKQVFIAAKNKKLNFDGTTLRLALNSHNRPSLTLSTPKCYKTSIKLLMKKIRFFNCWVQIVK
jgi:hypothetical protein